MKTTFTYLILCIILNFAVTGPVPEKKLIFDDLINFAKNTCLDLVTTPLFNRSTKYLSLCNKEPSSNLNKYNSDEYLCLGILDANYRLCKTKHDSGNKTISIPKTDAEIEKVVNESNGISENICKNFSKYPLEYKFNDLIKSNLNVIFNNDTICMKACDDFVKINPLCLFINLINSEIDSLKSQTHPTVEKKLEIVTAPANDNQRLQSVITKPKPLMQNVTNVQQRPDKPVQNPTNTKSSAPGAVTVEMKNEKSLTPENVPTAIKKPEIQGNSEVLSSEKSKVQTEDLIIQETQKPEDNKENKPEPQKPLTSDEFNDNGLDEDGNVNDIDYQGNIYFLYYYSIILVHPIFNYIFGTLLVL